MEGNEEKKLNLTPDEGQNLSIYIHNWPLLISNFFLGKIINNRRRDLDFLCLNPEPEQEKGLNFIKCLKTSKTTELLDKLVEDKEFGNWRSWEFTIEIGGGGCVKLNALHVAIIMQNEPVTSHMLNQGNPTSIALAKVQRFATQNRSGSPSTFIFMNQPIGGAVQ